MARVNRNAEIEKRLAEIENGTGNFVKAAIDLVDQCVKKVAERDAKIASLESCVDQRTGIIHRLEAANFDQGTKTGDLRFTLAEREKQMAARLCELNELKRELCDRDKVIDDMLRKESLWERLKAWLLWPL